VSVLAGVRFFVDRITDGYATLLPGDGSGSVTIPAEFLPGAREGDWLRASFGADQAEKDSMIR